MALLLSCENIHLEYPAKTVLDGVTLGIDEGDRIGIVGANGDGKSSLLGVLGRTVIPDSGQVVSRDGVRIGRLGQTDALDPDATVRTSVVGDVAEYVWASDARVRSIIDGLLGGIAWDGRIGDLSGGQRRRVDLARVLVGDWDVLLLDEPTNHLDMHGIAWLAEHLKRRWTPKAGALLVVTHDRWFLDEVCLGMWEVHDGRVDSFEGGYSAYVLQRVEREQAARVAEAKRRNIMRKELAWLARGAQARSTKPKFRVAAARDLIAEEPPVRNELALKQAAISRLGKQVVDVLDVTVELDGTRVLDDVTWLIGPGDRLGILGENGAGKTTLLKTIIGELSPTSGTVRVGKTVKFAVLSQHLRELEQYADQRVREVLGRYKTRYEIDGKELTPAQLLETLGFEQAHLNAYVHSLSGGQKRRLQLMLVLLDKPNVLILDEPGNDLDTDMLAVVESFLDSWPGTLLIVTHDRHLMERVSDDQFALIDGSLRHCPGGVDEWLALVDARAEATRVVPRDERVVRIAEADATTETTLSHAERFQLGKRLASTERKLSTAAEKVEQAKAALMRVDQSDFEALIAAQRAIDEAEAAAEVLENEWLELTELLG